MCGRMSDSCNGIGLLFKKDKDSQRIAETSDFLKMFLSSFAVGITNPAVILDVSSGFLLVWDYGRDGIGRRDFTVCGILELISGGEL